MADHRIESIEKMSLLEMNHKIMDGKIKGYEAEALLLSVKKKVRNPCPDEHKEELAERRSSVEKTMVLAGRMGQYKGYTELEYSLIVDYLINIGNNYLLFLTQASYDKIEGKLGQEIEQLEKRAENLHKSGFFEFFSFYVIVLTVAILGNIGSILAPEAFGFFPTVLGGALVVTFLILLFCRRFIGAIFLPVAIIVLSHLIETWMPTEVMKTLVLILPAVGVVLLLIRFVYKKFVSTPSKQRKIKEFQTDLSLYKQSIQEIITVFSFSCDEMVKTYRESGKSEQEIEKAVAYVQGSLSNSELKKTFDEVTKACIRYYTYVLNRLEEIKA